MCYEHTLVPLHNEDSDFFNAFHILYNFFSLVFSIKFQKTVATSSTCPPFLFTQEEVLILCCNQFELRISFLGHYVFA